MNLIELFKAKKSKGNHPSMQGKVPVKKTVTNPATGKSYQITLYVNPNKKKYKSIIKEQHPNFYVNANVQVIAGGKAEVAIDIINEATNKSDITDALDRLSKDDLKTVLVKVESPYVRDLITQKLYNERYDENFYKLLTNSNLIAPNKAEIAEIKDMIKNQILATHQGHKYQIAGIFKVKENPTEKRHQDFVTKKDNLHKNLWHGTHHDAFTNIIKDGFKVTYTKAGRALGDGVYLAPQASKSIQYCSSRIGVHDGGVLMLGDCAYGKVKNGGRLASNGKEDTVFLKGGGRFMYDELAIRDTAQYKVKYAVLINKKIYAQHPQPWEVKKYKDMIKDGDVKSFMDTLGKIDADIVGSTKDTISKEVIEYGLKKIGIKDNKSIFSIYHANMANHYVISEMFNNALEEVENNFDTMPDSDKEGVLKYLKDSNILNGYDSKKTLLAKKAYARFATDDKFIKSYTDKLELDTFEGNTSLTSLINGISITSGDDIRSITLETMDVLHNAVGRADSKQQALIIEDLKLSSSSYSSAENTIKTALLYRVWSKLSDDDFDTMVTGTALNTDSRRNLRLMRAMDGKSLNDPNVVLAVTEVARSETWSLRYDPIARAYKNNDPQELIHATSLVNKEIDPIDVATMFDDSIKFALQNEVVIANNSGYTRDKTSLFNDLFNDSGTARREWVSRAYNNMSDGEKNGIVAQASEHFVDAHRQAPDLPITLPISKTINVDSFKDVYSRLPDDVKDNKTIEISYNNTSAPEEQVDKIIETYNSIKDVFPNNKPVVHLNYNTMADTDLSVAIKMQKKLKDANLYSNKVFDGEENYDNTGHMSLHLQALANNKFRYDIPFKMPSRGGFRNLASNTGGYRPLAPKYYKLDKDVQALTSKAFDEHIKNTEKIMKMGSDDTVTSEYNQAYNNIPTFGRVFMDAIYTGALDDKEVAKAIGEAVTRLKKDGVSQKYIDLFKQTIIDTDDYNVQFSNAKINRKKKIYEKAGIS